VTNGNPRLVVTVEYPPTEMATPEDKDNFYESLQTHTSNVTTPTWFLEISTLG